MKTMNRGTRSSERGANRSAPRSAIRTPRLTVAWSPRPKRTIHRDLGRRVTFTSRIAGDTVCLVEQFPETGYREWSVVITLGAAIVIDRRRTRNAAMRSAEKFLRSKINRGTGSSSLVRGAI